MKPRWILRDAVVVAAVCVAVAGAEARAARAICINLAENDGNQGFAGGQLIGPLRTDSSNWNNTVNRTSGTLVSGTQAPLKDDRGNATAAGVVWNCSNTYQNNDGVGDDEHKMSVGYLDDGVSGVTVTVTNIPYARYRVYGLLASDQNQPNPYVTRNATVNGTFVMGGDAATTADAYGSVNANKAAHGEYWTELVPASVIGNYWTAVATNASMVLQGLPRNGVQRGSLTAVVVENLALDWGVPAAAAMTADGGTMTCDLRYDAATVTVVWAESDQGVSGLAAWTNAAGGGAAGLGPRAVGAVSNTISGLAADTAYAVRFYGVNGAGEDWSAPGELQTALTAAQQPAITNVEVYQSKVTLAWEDRSALETGFLVQWYTNGGSTTVVATTDNPWSRSLNEPATTYFYRVGATNANNGSFTGYSAWTNATIGTDLPPHIGAVGVQSVTVDGGVVTGRLQQAAADITVVWALTDQGTGQVADWAVAPGGGSAFLGARDRGELVTNAISGLEADTVYAFRLYATNAFGDVWSQPGSLVTGLAAEQQPTITSVAADLFSVTVGWESHASNFTGYVLQWLTDVGGTATLAVAASPFVHTGVGQGNTYRYRVGATNAANGAFSGYGAWTNATVGVLHSDLLAYDLFSAVDAVNNVTLNAQAYTTPDVAGFAGPWWRHGGNARTARNFNSDVAVGLQAIGSNARLGGVWDSNTGFDRAAFSTRQLAAAARLDLSIDKTYYWSFYGKATGDSSVNCGFAAGDAAGAEFFNVGLIWNNATSIGGAGNDAANMFYVGHGTLDGTTDNGVYGVRAFGDKGVDKEARLFFVGRVEARAATNDTVSMSVYDVTHVPEAGAAAVSWTATYRFDSSNTFTHLAFGFNGSGGLEFDGFRLGTNWSSVVGTHASADPVSAIGFNFVGNETVDVVNGRSPGTLAAGDAAGAPGVVQANWNNLQTAVSTGGGAPTNVVDSTGAPTAVTVEFASNNPYGTQIGSWSADNRLMRGYLDDSATTGQPYALVSAIPYPVYDVVLYVDNDTGAGTTYGPYWVESSDQTVLTPRVYVKSAYGNFAGAYIPVSLDSTNAVGAAYGNHVVFSGMTEPAIRIRGARQVGVTRGIMNAFQIVSRYEGLPGTILIVR